MPRPSKRAARTRALNLWWSVPERDEAARLVETTVRQLWDDDEPRREQTERNLRRYGYWLTGLHLDHSVRLKTRATEDLRVNIVKAAVETISAKVGSNRPRPRVLTTDGDFLLKQKAKKLQRFLDGAYSASEIYELSPSVFRDAMLSGTGIFSFEADIGAQTITARRVFPLEVLVDSIDAVDGRPTSLYRVQFLDKDDLIEKYPRFADEIDGAPAFGPDAESGTANADRVSCARLCRVVHAWRLACTDSDGQLVPGRYIMAVNGVALEHCDWEHSYYPFAFFHWSKPERGFWGQSAVQEVRPLENEFNRLLQQMQAALRIAGGITMLVPKDAKVKTAKLSNEMGIKVEYDGTVPPNFMQPANIQPGIMQSAEFLYRKAFEQLGTNQLAVSATKPAGIESGRALEQLGEEHSVRFKHISQHFENVVAVECSRQFLRCAQWLDARLKEKGDAKGFVLRSKSGKQMIKLPWQDVAISPDDFFIDCFPVGLLPHLPAGRMEAVQQYLDMGLIDSTIAAELLEFPDLDSVSNPVRADFNLTELQMSRMLEDGKPQLPDPRQNLQRALAYGTFCQLQAQIDGAPEERLDLVRDYLSTVEELLAQSAPPAPVDPAMAALPPEAAAAMPMAAAPVMA